MNILQVSAYAAPYEGNFIKSLYALEKILQEKGHSVYYAFPENASNLSWCNELMKRTKVFFLPLSHARIKPRTYKFLKHIVKKENIKIIHSHFELYDIACRYAATKDTRVFWHLHDPINKSTMPGRNIINRLQYSLFSTKTNLLSVCDHYKDLVLSFGYRGESAKTIVNGIDLSRITYPYSNTSRTYDFITFGWDFYRKGVDVILKVMNRLFKEGYSFKFLLNCNDSTNPYINEFFPEEKPSWLDIGRPVDDVNMLFSDTVTFIQASRRETFSYAVCEAAYAGLDVISSDIYGLEWAHSIPSVAFFESENEDQLYKLLKQRLDGNNSVSGMVIEQSREIIRKNYSINVWANRIINEYGCQ